MQGRSRHSGASFFYAYRFFMPTSAVSNPHPLARTTDKPFAREWLDPAHTPPGTLAMPFQFQQFDIDDSLCAMKVGTDGILLGAWCEFPSGASRLLDVGTGCGLIALMLAQRFPNARIDGIDGDADAIINARDNANACRWSHRLNFQHITLQQFSRTGTGRYDGIVCNPPFPTQGLRSPNSRRQTARQQSQEELKGWLDHCAALLKPVGQLALILPTGTVPGAILESHGWYPRRETQVQPLPDRPAKRTLWQLVRSPVAKPAVNRLVLETHHHQRSPEMQSLTGEFYLPRPNWQ